MVLANSKIILISLAKHILIGTKLLFKTIQTEVFLTRRFS